MIACAALLGAIGCITLGESLPAIDASADPDRTYAPPIPPPPDPDAAPAPDATPAPDLDPDPSPAIEDCMALEGCLRVCDDADCARGCREQVSADGAARYDAIFVCARESGCTEPGGTLNEACMQVNCQRERDACFGPHDPAEGTDCTTLDACYGTCGPDEPCRDGCRAAASIEARAQHQAALHCFAEAPCASDDRACRQLLCAPQLEACFGFAVVPAGNADCGTLSSCVNACDEYSDCVNRCYGESSPEAYNAYHVAVSCLREATTRCPPGDAQCAQDACADEITACIPPGVENCDAFNDCLQACSSDDQPCLDACVRAARPQAVEEYIAYQLCVETECPDGSPPSCALVNCEALLEACVGPVAVPRGAGGCSALNGCLDDCAVGDDGCIDGCVEAASATAYDRFLAAANCIEDSGCAAGDGECQQLNCGPEVQACVTDV